VKRYDGGFIEEIYNILKEIWEDLAEHERRFGLEGIRCMIPFSITVLVAILLLILFGVI